jgi:hypothetical protein
MKKGSYVRPTEWSPMNDGIYLVQEVYEAGPGELEGRIEIIVKGQTWWVRPSHLHEVKK